MDAREKWREVRATDVPVSLRLGPNTVDRFLLDPKRLGFYAARYTFAAKMLRDSAAIVDVGCGDGFFTTTFLSDTKAVDILGIDFDEDLIRYASIDLMAALTQARTDSERIDFRHADFFENGATGFDGLCCMDCIEHIDPERSNTFVRRLAAALNHDGVAVVGTPNEYAAHLGSPHSKLGHVNNFTPERLRTEMKVHFSTVFMFGLNDSTLHVGHEHLWHYIIAIGVKA